MSLIRASGVVKRQLIRTVSWLRCWVQAVRGGPGKRSQRGCYDVVGFGGGVANQQTVKKKRRIHSAEFKARVALEALKGIKTISQIAQDEGVHPVQVST